MNIFEADFSDYLSECASLFELCRYDRSLPLELKKDILEFSTSALKLSISIDKYKIEEGDKEEGR